jgi:hypothetical protein
VAAGGPAGAGRAAAAIGGANVGASVVVTASTSSARRKGVGGRSWARWWRLRRARAAAGGGDEEDDDGRLGVDVDAAKEEEEEGEEDQHSLASSSSPFLRFAVAIGAIWSLSARERLNARAVVTLGVTAEGDHHRPAALGRVFIKVARARSVSWVLRVLGRLSFFCPAHALRGGQRARWGEDRRGCVLRCEMEGDGGPGEVEHNAAPSRRRRARRRVARVLIAAGATLTQSSFPSPGSVIFTQHRGFVPFFGRWQKKQKGLKRETTRGFYHGRA